MDWIEGSQEAISYIEANIIENIGYEEVAKCVYLSSFYFQRTFSLLPDSHPLWEALAMQCPRSG